MLLLITTIFVFFNSIILESVAVPVDSSPRSKSDIANNGKALFWQSSVRKGANVFNRKINSSLITAAKEYSIDFIRLAPDKFPSSKRDFLIGDADNYTNLVYDDLKILKRILDDFHSQQIPVVLTMLSLPGSRWKQNNNGKDDLRLWLNKKFQNQAIKFWQELASELKDHPAIVGYDILNEPHLESLLLNQSPRNSSKKFLQELRHHLLHFYADVIKAIREVDQNTPIILESSNHADPSSFNQLEPIPPYQKNILYSFHMYEPFPFTSGELIKANFSYPGLTHSSFDEEEIDFWNKTKVEAYMEPVRAFQEKYNVSSDQILVGEFGAVRFSNGVDRYFKDLISIFKRNRWHSAVYAFREDTWDGMDYELGSKRRKWNWKTKNQVGDNHDDHDHDDETKKMNEKEYLPNNTIFSVLREQWAN